MAKLIREQGYDARYDIIGGDILESPRQPHLERYSSRLGLSDVVTFHGQVDSVIDLLHQLDVVVCPSHEEAFPISILEAMALEMPIVATNVNGIPEAIEDGVSGLLVNPHNPIGLADAVIRIMRSPQLGQTLGRAARDRVKECFSQHSYGKKVRDLYDQLLSS
jgi:glycosyltransferase involved in cell wall biosynthesis